MDEDFVRELFAAEGPVRIRRMFGGYGIYLGDLIVAIYLRDELLLKGDAESEPAFLAAGSRRWTYQRPGGSARRDALLHAAIGRLRRPGGDDSLGSPGGGRGDAIAA